MPRYGEKTEVTPARSRSEIEHTLDRYGVTTHAWAVSPGTAQIAFEASGVRVRISIALPTAGYSSAAQLAQAVRQRWRALALVLKAKLEAVDSGIETVEQAFLPYIVLPDGSTVADNVAPQLKAALASGTVPALLTERALTA